MKQALIRSVVCIIYWTPLVVWLFFTFSQNFEFHEHDGEFYAHESCMWTALKKALAYGKIHLNEQKNNSHKDTNNI